MSENRRPTIEEAGVILRTLIERLEQHVVGQRPMLERLVVALLSGGHVLIEGVPGLAKTKSVRALARMLDLPFRRIQFTPDLLPADLTGTQIYRPSSGTFDVRHGPIVTSVLLADEINRAPAKVQSALLEAMEEGQVTVGDDCVSLPEPFWVLATQNPIEHDGTYPLPEAQLDRFLFKLLVSYPSREFELAILDLPPLDGERVGLLDRSRVLELRALARGVHVAPAIKGYIVDIARATRSPADSGFDIAHLVELGAGPRASIALLAASKSLALLSGRDYVVPHDVKSLAGDVLRHRIRVSYQADAEGVTSDQLIARILDGIRVP